MKRKTKQAAKESRRKFDEILLEVTETLTKISKERYLAIPYYEDHGGLRIVKNLNNYINKA